MISDAVFMMPELTSQHWLWLALFCLISALLTWWLTHAHHRAQWRLQQTQWDDKVHTLSSELASAEALQQHTEHAYHAQSNQLQQLQLQHHQTLTRLGSAETEIRQIAPLQGNLEEAKQQNHQLMTTQQQHLSQLAAAEQALQHWQSRQQEWQQQQQAFQTLQQQHADTCLAHERLHTQLHQERQAYEEKLALLTEAREALSNQFKNLANDILEEKSKRFAEQNQHSLGLLLNPLHERMQGFSQLIQNTYEKEAKERTTLESELKRLQQLNTQLHSDAQALTHALTGSQNKTQGNWGEMILEKVLESAGLTKGREYIIQASSTQTDEYGQQRRVQPDVLINLPDNKQIIIDAKVSLTAYVRHTQATDSDSARQALNAHVQSVRNHIKTLSAKQYQDIEGLNTLDFVFLFIPVEPAYLLALQQDNQLFDECFTKRIMLVGPSTLLATMRTVANLWRNEQQNQNALKIAQAGGKLYDKLVLFVNNLESVGKNLDQAQSQYQKAMGQLHTGRGSLVSQAEKLRQLGVKASKSLPADYLAQAADDEDSLAALPEKNPDAATKE